MAAIQCKWLVLAVLLPTTVAAQEAERVPLTLAEAEAAALTGNAELRAVGAEARAADRTARAAGAFRWPGLEATAGVVGSDDPVAAFGARLRQERFGMADLDVGRLNDPETVTDWSAGLGVRWEIGDPARWMSLTSARSEAEAAEAVLHRTAQAVRYRARILWLEAYRTLERRGASEAAYAAAAATRDRVAARVDEGMATDADLLLARAALHGAEAGLLTAEVEAADAADALARWLGWSGDRTPVPTAEPDAPSPTAGASPPAALGSRWDLVASSASLVALRARVREATSGRWPRLSGFAGVATHRGALDTAGGTHWTAGLQLSVPLFSGFGLRAGAEAARARLEASEARHEARVREVESEVAQARRGVDAAERRQEAARAAAEAAREAARLIGLRYAEGMATLTELLGSEAEASRLDALAVDAAAGFAMALATLDFALGGDPDPLSTEGGAR